MNSLNKVLLIFPGLNLLNDGGAKHRFLSFASSYYKRNFRVYLLVFVPLKIYFKKSKYKSKLDSRYNWIIIPSISFFSNRFLAFVNRLNCKLITLYLTKKIKPSVIQAETSLGGELTRFVTNVPLVVDFHADLIPELKFRDDDVNWKINRARKENVFSLKNANQVIAVSNNLRNHLKNEYFAQANISLIPCAADVERFNVAVPRDLNISNKIVIGYLGGLQKWQCIRESIDLVSKLKVIDDRVFFCLFTNDDTKDIELELKNIFGDDFMIKGLKHSLVPEYLKSMDIGLLLRGDDTLNLVSSPTKTSEYLAAGCAVITTKFAGNAPDIIGSSDCGLILDSEVVSDESLIQISNYISFVNENSNNIKAKAVNLINNGMDWESNFNIFFDSLKDVSVVK